MTKAKTAPAPNAGDRVEIAPKGGARVRDPLDGEPLPKEGKEVAWSDFWTRRLADEDIGFVDPEPPPPPRSPPPPPPPPPQK